MEETSEYSESGRYQTCSKERIKVQSHAIERHHPLQCTPSLLYPEGNQNGNWTNHIRKYMRHPGRLRTFPSKTSG